MKNDNDVIIIMKIMINEMKWNRKYNNDIIK